MVSNASELLPEPESPVKTTRLSRGISTLMFLRLCSRAPRIFDLVVLGHADLGDVGRQNANNLFASGSVPRRAMSHTVGYSALANRGRMLDAVAILAAICDRRSGGLAFSENDSHWWKNRMRGQLNVAREEHR